MSPIVSVMRYCSAGRGPGLSHWTRIYLMETTRGASGIKFVQTFPLTNLFDSNNSPPMQIDGNCGLVSRIATMLLPSHANSLLHLLPALQSSVPAGFVTGLVARAGFFVDILLLLSHM